MSSTRCVGGVETLLRALLHDVGHIPQLRAVLDDAIQTASSIGPLILSERDRVMSAVTHRAADGPAWLITVAEAALHFNRSQSKIREWIKTGVLPHIKPDGDGEIMIPVREAEEALRAQVRYGTGPHAPTSISRGRAGRRRDNGE